MPQTSSPEGTLSCLYCRTPGVPVTTNCPHCGAPLDVRTAVTQSGWVRQPGIRDLTRIQFGTSRVQIEGTQVPVADFALAAGDRIYFSHHGLLWTDPGTRIASMGLRGARKRRLAGLPSIMMEAYGPGRIALSDNHAGDLIAIPLAHGQTMWVRAHRFLAATGNVAYTWQNTGVWFSTGNDEERRTHYPVGQFGDLFTAEGNPGLMFLHSPGNTFLRDLAVGETILVQPGALLYRDLTVTAHLHLEYPPFHGLAVSYRDRRNTWLRLVGPGRVAIQSIFDRQSPETIRRSSPATYKYWDLARSRKS
jgi:uncharacterized protein (AIM24 family)